jgi:hypothetical protein
MNTRLVAYRPALSSDTQDSTYQLDLQESPNIAVNFQLSDIREPQTRKASFSQTFKLPFTKNNNKFFQDWYNVNASTLVFDTRTKFTAILYVGTVPQLEGSLQLKAVYQKAEVYEVVLMSNSADLFSIIGDKRLREVFAEYNADGEITGYSEELNHVFDESSFENSWNGGSSAFQNTAGISLRDTTVDVQKVMYPMSVTQPEFYWKPQSNQFLDMTQYDIDNTTTYPNGAVDAKPYMASLLQFRPAIQIKTLFKLILAKAGLRYTSSFIDGDYFGKIFMTTGNHLGESTLPTTESSATDWAGNMRVGYNGEWGVYCGMCGDFPDIDCNPTLSPTVVPANIENTDYSDSWNNEYYYFTKQHPTQLEMTVKHKVLHNDVIACSGTEMQFDVWVQGYSATSNTPIIDVVYDEILNIELEEGVHTHILDISGMVVGESCQILMRPKNINPIGDPSTQNVKLGATASIGPTDSWESKITVTWDNYSTGIYGANIDVPMCIDPNITQKDFLKDIIQRFNLVVFSDSDDATNLIIKPYNDYLASGDIKDWTKKLDLSKEVIIKDTTHLQKKSVKFSDLEDEDLANKSYKEEYPEINVYGHVDVKIAENNFATGELTNDPIFSPYINDVVYKTENTDIIPYPANMVVQYEHTYKTEDGIHIATSAGTTKPKLFWYNGSPTTVKSFGDSTLTYNLHREKPSGIEIVAYTFTTYPVCTPFDITPSSDSYTLGPTNKSLYWWSNPPICESDIFNYDAWDGSWKNNTLYGLYWENYLRNIYSPDARIMECYLNLNEVDIFNFKFNDELFIKDTYWRVLKIENYQVGSKSSTKVILIKVLDALLNCSDCNHVIGYDSNGSNIFAGLWWLWCPDDDPDCSSPSALGAGEQCCICNGGDFFPSGACLANPGSLPLIVQNHSALRNILGGGGVKTLLSNKFGGLKNPLIRGVDNTKYSRSIVPPYGDDIVIKYKTKRKGTPQLKGENHRFVLVGFTEGNTRSYAYPEGSLSSTPLQIPTQTNIIIRVKGTATVVGGSSTNYPLGTVEGFAYYTAFKNIAGGVIQLGTAGGDQEFALRESGPPSSTCTLYIDMDGDLLRFGLDDSQTDTKRIWALTIDLDVNNVHNFALGYGENWALYQNGQNIQFQNGDFLIWN